MAELSNHSYHYKHSVFKREETETNNLNSETNTSSKKKPRRRKRMLTGVSKQRRAANERERNRLHTINGAFKDLKSILPLFPEEDNISKIEIVRLASRTIKHLSEIVNNDFIGEFKQEARSPGGSELSDASCSTYGSSEADIKQEEMTYELFPPDDFKLTDFEALVSDLASSTSNGSSSTSSSTDGLQDIDISSFIEQNNIDDDDDVFPSMLYW